MSQQDSRSYVVQHRYRAGEYGPWEAGAIVELTEAQAAHIERDSPGALRRLDASQGERDIPAPPRDRMQRPSSRRKAP